MNNCGICAAQNMEDLEALGLEAVRGERSWRSAARDGGLSHLGPLKNHMEKHWTPEVVQLQDANSEATSLLIQQSVGELQREMAMASPDLKPLYALAIKNLTGLADTKPSQSHLIQALKAIHEIRGMKSQQALLIEYAANFQGVLDVQPADELEAGAFEEAQLVD